jgi:hypothetical protein
MSARAMQWACIAALAMSGTAAARNVDWTHVVESDYALGETHVRYAGEVMLSRADFYADAERLPLVRPQHKVMVGMPTAGTMSFSPSDTLRVIGTLTHDGQTMRVAVPPRGVAFNFAFLIAPDGYFDGALAYLEPASTGRLRPRALDNRARADVVPTRAMFLPQYKVRAIDTTRAFSREAWVFVGASDGAVQLERRSYRDASDDSDYNVQYYALPAQAGAQQAGELRLMLLDIEPQRLKYRIDAD